MDLSSSFFLRDAIPKKRGQKKGDPPLFIQMAHDPPFFKAILQKKLRDPPFFPFFLWIGSSGGGGNRERGNGPKSSERYSEIFRGCQRFLE